MILIEILKIDLKARFLVLIQEKNCIEDLLSIVRIKIDFTISLEMNALLEN